MLVASYHQRGSPEEGLQASSHDKPQGFPLWSVMVALTLVNCLMLLDVSIVSTKLLLRYIFNFRGVPAITNEFGSLRDIGCAALQPLAGKVYTNFYPKWVFLVFFLLFEVGSLICALANSSSMLIIGRAVAGMGTSGTQNGFNTIIAGIVPLQKRPALIGIAFGFAQIGLASGPLVGVVAVLLVMVRIPDPVPKAHPMAVLRTLHKKMDFPGFFAFAGSSIMLLLAPQYGDNQFPWYSATVIGCFCGAGATFLLWLFWNWKQGEAGLIPLSLICLKPVWSSCATFGLSMGALLTTSYFLPIYFQGVRGASPLMSGIQVLPNIIPQIITAVLAGVLVTKFGYYLPFSLLGTVLFTIGSALISTYSLTTPLGHRIGYQPIIAVQNSVSPEKIPIVSAMLTFTQQSFGSLLVSFGNTILTNSLKILLPGYAPSVDPERAIAAGATELRNVVSLSILDDVLRAYTKSVNRVYYLAAGCGAAAFFISWGMGWKDIRKNRANSPTLPADQEKSTAQYS
ncbi:major facilitator superfamily domain-containing protein [Aspergillus leporis]|uniref:Major facilitator superfamily domain-containing protein n=1 Tax=Aspergillus leporis TaxID=41062 RepID=A0A5N5XD51_9EURO|nr:major facilitator superfamily domain-containing protein [Aspergillus leporis]